MDLNYSSDQKISNILSFKALFLKQLKKKKELMSFISLKG